MTGDVAGSISGDAEHAHRRVKRLNRLPPYGLFGLGLTLVAWTSSWGRIGPWNYTFFPLWLGFVLFLDGVNRLHHGSSPLMRGRGHFIGLFLVSVPVWWTFEALDAPLGNWHYIFDQQYSGLAYNLFASLCFSTVVPAVFEIAELLTVSLHVDPQDKRGSLERLPGRWAIPSMVLGLAMIVSLFAAPGVAFPLIWWAPFFILDPINSLAGRRSLLSSARAGAWGPVLLYPCAALCCGFFWEMWNSRALPRWYYTVPGLGKVPHLFAMPLPGYLGYLPFGLELFALYQFARVLCRRPLDTLVP